MKPWEEEWWTRFETGCFHSLRLDVPNSEYRGSIIAEFEGEDDDANEARAKFAAAAPDTARLLLRVANGGECPFCFEQAFHDEVELTHPHLSTCELAAVLRKAGVRP